MSTRSPSILVIAILNLLVGAYGVLASFCLGAALAFFAHGSVVVASAPGVLDPFALFDLCHDSTFQLYLICSSLLRVSLAVCLILAGVGLLGHKAWARRLSLAYALTRLSTAVAELVLLVLYVNPVACSSAQIAPRLRSTGIDLEAWANCGAVLWFVGAIVYPLAIFLVILRARGQLWPLTDEKLISDN